MALPALQCVYPVRYALFIGGVQTGRSFLSRIQTLGFGVMVNDPRIFILNTFIPNESSTLPMVTESLFMKVYSTVNEDCPLSNEVVEMDMN